MGRPAAHCRSGRSCLVKKPPRTAAWGMSGMYTHLRRWKGHARSQVARCQHRPRPRQRHAPTARDTCSATCTDTRSHAPGCLHWARTASAVRCGARFSECMELMFDGHGVHRSGFAATVFCSFCVWTRGTLAPGRFSGHAQLWSFPCLSRRFTSNGPLGSETVRRNAHSGGGIAQNGILSPSPPHHHASEYPAS